MRSKPLTILTFLFILSNHPHHCVQRLCRQLIVYYHSVHLNTYNFTDSDKDLNRTQSESRWNWFCGQKLKRMSLIENQSNQYDSSRSNRVRNSSTSSRVRPSVRLVSNQLACCVAHRTYSSLHNHPLKPTLCSQPSQISNEELINTLFLCIFTAVINFALTTSWGVDCVKNC